MSHVSSWLGAPTRNSMMTLTSLSSSTAPYALSRNRSESVRPRTPIVPACRKSRRVSPSQKCTQRSASNRIMSWPLVALRMMAGRQRRCQWPAAERRTSGVRGPGLESTLFESDTNAADADAGSGAAHQLPIPVHRGHDRRGRPASRHAAAAGGAPRHPLLRVDAGGGPDPAAAQGAREPARSPAAAGPGPGRGLSRRRPLPLQGPAQVPGRPGGRAPPPRPRSRAESRAASAEPDGLRSGPAPEIRSLSAMFKLELPSLEELKALVQDRVREFGARGTIRIDVSPADLER